MPKSFNPESTETLQIQGACQADLAHLLARVAARDRTAFAILYYQTNAKLNGGICLILARSDLVGEVLQETYVNIWKKAGVFDATRDSPMTWMATIARNCALDEKQCSKSSPLVVKRPDDLDRDAEILHSLVSRDRILALARCLELLDADKRHILLLAYFRGVSRAVLSKPTRSPVPAIEI
jgi:RNA polymerase sigma-70 factor (ECF subfamily)